MAYILLGRSHLGNQGPPRGEEHQMDVAMKRELIYRHDGSMQLELEHHVHLRTGRRVRNLSVELLPEAVVLRGSADSYYVKQLAQEGILELLPEVHLQNAIAVNPLD
jgi:hypothetical protein